MLDATAKQAAKIDNGQKLADLFFDWFCPERQLPRRGRRLRSYLKDIASSDRISTNDVVIFKNNCIGFAKADGVTLYDDFRICDPASRDVIFTVVPEEIQGAGKGKATVWGRENGFRMPLVEGSWADVVNWFLAPASLH